MALVEHRNLWTPEVLSVMKRRYSGRPDFEEAERISLIFGSYILKRLCCPHASLMQTFRVVVGLPGLCCQLWA